MKEVLEFIFQSFWTFTGTCFLICLVGHASALPFYWYYKIKEKRLSRSLWHHLDN
mgnify:CR=1 FL=1